MKANKIIYWATTILVSLGFTMSAVMYLSGNPEVVAGFKLLGYPPYFLHILATAKLLGVVALLQTKSHTLKEWAYAGFTINIIGATWSHLAINDSIASPLMFGVLLAVSYIFYHRSKAQVSLQSAKA